MHGFVNVKDSHVVQPARKEGGVKNKAHVLKIVVLIVNVYKSGRFREDTGVQLKSRPLTKP